jgi:hypothetical protein
VAKNQYQYWDPRLKGLDSEFLGKRTSNAGFNSGTKQRTYPLARRAARSEEPGHHVEANL